MGNDRLRDALDATNLTYEKVAEAVDVDPKPRAAGSPRPGLRIRATAASSTLAETINRLATDHGATAG